MGFDTCLRNIIVNLKSIFMLVIEESYDLLILMVWDKKRSEERRPECNHLYGDKQKV